MNGEKEARLIRRTGKGGRKIIEETGCLRKNLAARYEKIGSEGAQGLTPS